MSGARTIPALVLALLASVLPAGCNDDQGPVRPGPDPAPNLTLLALGDSYTVGHSLPTAWSWPWQLADSLAAGGDTLRTVAVVARTGWTTRDLLGAVRAELAAGTLTDRPRGLVTLMIGVNNQFQGLDMAVFAAELDTLVDLAVDLAGGDAGRVLGFSIPDYGVTPVGSYYGTQRVCDEIAAHNAVVSRTFAAKGVVMIDVTPLSLEAGSDPRLVAKDGLHYSREMYARWVALMLPAVRAALGLDGSGATAAAASSRPDLNRGTGS